MANRNKSKHPAITIGIPTKNSEKTIADCLMGVIDCDYEKAKMEIILAVGKSEDRTADMLKTFQEIGEKGGIKFQIFSDEGKGLGYARQLIVENAHGDYVFWVDSDCVIAPNLLKVQVDFVTKNPLVGIVIPLVLPTGKSVVQRLQGYTWLMPTLNAMKGGRTPYITMQGAITPVSVLKEVKGFNLAIKGAGEDADLVNRMRIKGYNVLVNPKAIVYHQMKKSYKELLRHIAWYGRTEPKKPVGTLMKECFLRTLLYIKLIPLTMKTFRDSACILMPLHIIACNFVWLISHFSQRYYWENQSSLT